MMWLLIYLAIGVALGFLCRVENDRFAITAGLQYTALFLFLWPVVLLYVIHMIMKGGVIKYKGKVIWKAKQ